MPLPVKEADVGSNPIIHPKFRIGSSGVEQLVEAQRGGGSNPSRCTKQNVTLAMMVHALA